MRPDEGCRAGGRLLLRVKHLLDWIVAAVALVILSPLLLGIALWILVESGRPVLLSQERAGKDGRPFRMLKFRTMVPDAIAAGRALVDDTDDPQLGPQRLVEELTASGWIEVDRVDRVAHLRHQSPN
jgi:Bacterial sugar transferase